jgi:hypothetical protein
MTGTPAALLTLVLVLGASPVVMAGEFIRITPSVSGTTVHDSNLFSTASARQADLVARLSAGADGEYRSSIWALVGRCSFDAERFERHPELTTMNARRHGELGMTYAPTRRLTITAASDASGTQNPGELNRDTGLSFTRAAARHLAARGSIARRFDRETTATIGYAYASDSLLGSLDTRVQELRLAAEHRLSSRDTTRSSYRVQRFAFSGTEFEPSTTIVHTLSVGLTRSITRQTTVAIDAGPTVNGGSVSAEVMAGLQHHTTSFDYSVNYGRTQAIVLGLAGTAVTQSVTTTAAWALRRALQIRVSPAFYQTRLAFERADVGRVSIDVLRTLTPGVSLEFGFDSGIQHGTLHPTTEDAAILHRTTTIRIVASPPSGRTR